MKPPFRDDFTFVSPRTYRTNQGIPANGVVVIESDDGKIGDYTHWYPLSIAMKHKYSQWVPVKPIPICPNINSFAIGQSGYMTVANLQELNSSTWEILAHGKYHTGLGLYALADSAQAGSTTIKVMAPGQFKYHSLHGHEYRITESDISEVIRVTAKDMDTVNAGFIAIDDPLVNSYSTDARIVLLDEWIKEELEGCINDLASWGIDAKHFTYSYHGGSQYQRNEPAIDYISQLFESARGVSGKYNNTETPRHLLKSQDLNPSVTTALLDDILDTTKSSNCLTIFYGHGEQDDVILGLLKHIIDGCFSRGIEIMTRSDAVEWLYGN